MTNTTRSQRPPQAKRRARRSSLGCSLAFVAVLVILAGGALALGPSLLDRLLGAPTTSAPATVTDQTSPEKLAALRQQESAQLEGYGWVNQAGGIAHIPINRAIALVAEKGLPVGKPQAQATAASETAATNAPTPTVDLANVSFTNDVLPIFQQHCLKCHGNDNPEKGLELTSYKTMMLGSEEGSVVTPGDPDKSYLVEMVVTKKMPKKGAPLSATEINTIIAWVKAGAKDDTGTAPKKTPAQASTAVTTTTTAPVDLAHVSFKNNVLPIFQQHCQKCHGNDNPEEGLELTSYRTTMTGSQNGSVVEPGDPDNSYLVKMVVSKKMPKKGPPLSSTEIDTLIAWIKAGAQDDTDSAPAAPAAQSTAPVSATEQSAQATVTETPAPTAKGTEAQATATATITVTASPSAQETTTSTPTGTEEATTTPTESVTGEATAGTPTSSETTATETAPPLATTETPTATTTSATTPTSSSTAASSMVSTTTVTTTAAVDLTNVSFQKNVLPIFQQHCLKCHGNEDPEEGLELTKYRTVMTGSENGSVVEPGDPDNSYLVKMVVSKKMPKKGPPLASIEIETIIAWIKAGAKDN